MNRMTRAILCGAVVAAMAGLSLPAAAFFPVGAWNANGQLIFIKWPFALMDTNGDGDIAGANEGIPYFIEEGNLGWRESEIVTIREALDLWQNVPTAYVAFREQGRLVNPRPGTDGDRLNTISLAFDGETEAGLIPAGNLGIIIYTVAVDDQIIDPGVQVSGGQFIQADIIVNAAAIRPELSDGSTTFDLKSIIAHSAGRFIGLHLTPLNNLRNVGTDDNPVYIEPPAVSMRNAMGQLVHVGATPTMFPVYFETETDLGLRGGWATLAPDDVAGVSFLYPRGSQSEFFGIYQEVRDQSSFVLPSVPVAGSHIVAWADTDNSPGTPRVPLISTMSGLYADNTDVSVRGRFRLTGLPKQLETFGSPEPFQVSYTFTSGPLDGSGVVRQAPPGYGPDDFDSTHLAEVGGAGRGYVLQTAFYGETFHERENVLGVDKYSVGTPLVFDTDRQKPVSTVTGLTLDSILAGYNPMFGDQVGVCPLNVAAAGLKTVHGNDALRGLRDTWLRRSDAGRWVINTYYAAAPAATAYLVAHPKALGAARGAMWLVETTIVHAKTIALVVLASALGGWALVRRRRKAAAAALLVLACLAAPLSAEALTYVRTTSDLVGLSDEVVFGRVQAVEVKLNASGQPVTCVQFAVADAAFRGLNRGSVLYLEQLGGRVGDVITHVSDYPAWQEGEECVLYLRWQAGEGRYTVTAGVRGKLEVVRQAQTGQPVVLGVQNAALDRVKTSASGDAREGVALDQYLDYVRKLAQDEEMR